MSHENLSHNKQADQQEVLMLENGKKVRKIILDEDSFVKKLDKIVERDYFPDLKKLKANHLFEDEEPNDEEISLGQFLSKYTSEDNASFKEIIDETNKRHREKYSWFYLDENEIRKQIEDNLKVPSIENQTAGKTENVVTWAYKNMNSIMFNPEGHELTAKEVLEENSKSKQKIMIENTRFKKPPFRKTVYRMNTNQSDTSSTTSTSSKQFVQSKYDPTGDLISTSVKEYKLVESTPLIEPNEISSPIMTWGAIESTPMLIENEIEATPNSGRFKIPDMSIREKTALKLTDNFSKSKKQTTSNQQSSKWTPSPMSPRTPRHLDQLSPAVQQFAQSKLRMNIKNDYQNISSSFMSNKSPSPFYRNFKNIRSSSRSLSNESETSCSTITDNLLKLSKND